LGFGLFGYVLIMLRFEPAPILLGFVLVLRLEENFRRALLISHGDISTFVSRPISAVFLTICLLLISTQIYVRLQRVAKQPPRDDLSHASE
jgi:putative tricarboxylic transport membrane protein